MNEPESLARRVDYRRTAIRRRTIAGAVDLSSLPRVAAETADGGRGDRVIDVELTLTEDSQRRVRIAGRITATLSLRCQRCLRNYDQALTPAVAGVVVASDVAAADVPHADEPILADGEWLDIYALVGDELLLALPPVARCDRRDCHARYEQTSVPAESDTTTTRQNPFAVLKTLKRDG